MRAMNRNDWGKVEVGGSDSTYISGGYLKSFYDKKNNVMVSYYFDHNEGRYVKSIQDLPSVPKTIGGGTYTQPLIFQWLDRGRHSSIPI
jgi:hypothetical protein